MIEVTDKSAWESIVSKGGSRSGAFLQSWVWGALQQSLGRTVRRYRVDDAHSQVITVPLPLGKQYQYLARGPMAKNIGAAKVFVQSVREQSENDLFLRIDSMVDFTLLKDARHVKDVQPSTTLITDLTQTREALLGGMHQKTRYNLRLAQKKQLQVAIDSNDLDAFMDLVKRTAARHGIRAHGRAHYEAILKHLDGKDGNPRAWIAVVRHGSAVVAANLMVDYNGTRTYLHGASSYEDRSLMAPYLLHWELMQNAASKGLRAYDWWGIAPPGETKHPLAGVTRFKRGFGGDVVSLPRTVDVVLKPAWYKLYTIARSLRRAS